MQMNTEDAKKIAGAYLLSSTSHERQYRAETVQALNARYGVDKVKDLPNEEAPAFIRDLLDVWEKPS